jgi:uncharacterized protein with FMN-binding domain
MDQKQSSKKREIIAGLAVLIVIVAIVAATSLSGKKKNTADSTATPSKTTTSTTSSSSTYKDGNYTATGSYDSPGGAEEITISVTLKDDIITTTSAKSGAGDPEADQYQDQFISGYKSDVVGKDISKVSLSRVSGSSLTSQGFNDAISQIEKQAQS